MEGGNHFNFILTGFEMLRKTPRENCPVEGGTSGSKPSEQRVESGHRPDGRCEWCGAVDAVDSEGFTQAESVQCERQTGE